MLIFEIDPVILGPKHTMELVIAPGEALTLGNGTCVYQRDREGTVRMLGLVTNWTMTEARQGKIYVLPVPEQAAETGLPWTGMPLG